MDQKARFHIDFPISAARKINAIAKAAEVDPATVIRVLLGFAVVEKKRAKRAR